MGASGGILVMWDKRVVESSDEFVGEFSVGCLFRNIDDGFLWAFAGVYGPNLDSERRMLWDELAGLCSWWEVPWCIGGDFNVTRFASERSGEGRQNQAMVDFSDFIFESGLMDIPLMGGEYTWSNHFSWSRLDRFLISPSWELQYPVVSQKRLPRICSDHFLVMLDGGGIIGGRRPFKFENMWLKKEGFVDLVRQWWSSYLFEGNPSNVLARKLKALKMHLKIWNEQVFGDVTLQMKSLTQELQSLEGVGVENNRKEQVVSELERLTLLEEISWRQKSRALWLREGD
ncbi:uncharacterized protein LOC118347981 [Juglans regia]|uniref:Uncharacterized protein LOC118347981 n=1 Tax=Juglans regia TaxID=51240 RepID=A0A6P9EB82_JUGRE|nr:uncharacterized protein LOC118347981 [Juglans regia]